MPDPIVAFGCKYYINDGASNAMTVIPDVTSAKHPEVAGGTVPYVPLNASDKYVVHIDDKTYEPGTLELTIKYDAVNYDRMLDTKVAGGKSTIGTNVDLQVKIEFGNGDTYQSKAVCTGVSLPQAGERKDLLVFTTMFQLSGAPTFTAAP